MASPKIIAAGVVLVIAAVVGSMCVFTVRQDQQALVLQFGNPVHAVSEPGLHFKLPIQNVEYYERRILELDPPVQQVLLSDQKRVNVDSFARWKIIDPLIFRQRATNSANFVQLFGQRLNSVIRGELAQAPLVTLLSDNRAQIMEKIQSTLIKPAEEFGVELIDVRIGRTDLPQETSQAVYNRMRSSRIAEAAQLRAEGEELKAKIQAELIVNVSASSPKPTVRPKSCVVKAMGSGTSSWVKRMARTQNSSNSIVRSKPTKLRLITARPWCFHQTASFSSTLISLAQRQAARQNIRATCILGWSPFLFL